MCDHKKLETTVDVQAIKGGDSRSVDVKFRCIACGKRFIVLGYPVGVRTETLRFIIEPMVD